MVIIYTSPSCLSCRKAKLWFKEHNIPYLERNITLEPLKDREFKKILQMTQDGTHEIISIRSKVYQKLQINLDHISMKKLYDLIQKNPSLLKKPIILDEKRLQVGYQEEDIRQFLPRVQRSFQLQKALQKMARV